MIAWCFGLFRQEVAVRLSSLALVRRGSSVSAAKGIGGNIRGAVEAFFDSFERSIADFINRITDVTCK